MRFIFTWDKFACDTLEDAIKLREQFATDFERERVAADPLYGIGIHAYLGTMKGNPYDNLEAR